MARPTLPESEKRRSLSAKVAPETCDRVQDLAADWGLSLGRTIDRLVAQAAPKRGGRKP